MLQDFLIVFSATALISIVIYYWIAGERRPGNLLLLFLSLLLGAWAGGLSIMPFMERIYGIYWAAFILAALVYAAVIYFFLWPYKKPGTRGEALRRAKALVEAERLLKVTLVVVLIISFVYVVFSYAN